MRFLALLLASSLCGAALTPAQKTSNLESFEYVWSTIRDKHWDKTLDGAEWKAVHDELLPQVKRAETMQNVRSVLKDMIGRLHLTHFAVIPADVYSELHRGALAMDVRLIDGRAILVRGKYAGWEVEGVSATMEKVGATYARSTMREMMIARAVATAAADRTVTLSDGHGHRVALDSAEFAPRGEPATFGNLPTQYVWTESRQIGAAGYFSFNLFLDPARLIPALAQSIQTCRACSGFAIDLRGNSGGIGAMAMGMAGFFIQKPGELLGNMVLRESSLKFAINPRTPQFTGKLAVLVDGLSASTAEIFAGGLQDLNRARVFGSTTAGAALPSVIERLPNGDAFQYAIANYVSQGGSALEGKGVSPDIVVTPVREHLLEGRDDALERALQWLQTAQP